MTFTLPRAAAATLAAATAVALAACSGQSTPTDSGDDAVAVEYPTKTVTVIVPYAAGGLTDVAARALSETVSEELGQQFVVENKPGAAGITGTAEVAAADADGYTVLFTVASSIENSLYRETPFTFDDFVPVAGVYTQPYVLVAPAGSQYQTFEDVEAASGPVTYSSTGVGTPTHIDALVLFEQLGIEATNVPFDGAAPAVQNIVGGNSDFFLGDASSVIPYIEDGSLVALGQLTGDGERATFLPDVPSFDELGIDTSSFTLPLWGIAVKAGTPDSIVTTLRDAYRAAIDADSFQTFAQEQYYILLEGDAETGWYEQAQLNGENINATLTEHGITL